MNRIFLTLLTLLCMLLACGDTNDEPTPKPPTPPPVAKHNIAYNLNGNLIRAGKEPVGEVLFNIDGNLIRLGDKPTGEILYTIDGNYIRVGKDNEIIYNFDEKYIRFGDKEDGEILYNFDGDYVRVGKDTWETRLYEMSFDTWSNGAIYAGNISIYN